MRKLLAALGILTLASPVNAAAHSAAPRRLASAQAIITKADTSETMTEIWTCTHRDNNGGFHIDLQTLTCDRTFHGVHWTLKDDWSGDFERPAGKWHFFCKHDALEQTNSCILLTQPEGQGLFLVAISEGYEVSVQFGGRVGPPKYPGSEQIIRVDERPLVVTTADGYSDAQSAMIYRQMMAAKMIRYRWYDWPDHVTQNGTLDISDFRWEAALLEVILMSMSDKAAVHPEKFK